MLRWIGNALASSVGRKIVLGLTGFLLLGFCLNHIAGNVKLFGDGFNDYVHMLKGFGPLLLVAEIGLAGLFACHIFLALRLTMENRKARSERYVVRNDRGAQTFGSVSMFYTGAILLAFLIKHLLDFRFASGFEADPEAMVFAKLSQTGNALIYVLASIVLAIHLSHGFRSAFQSVGLSHPKLDAILTKAGIGVAALIGLAFASFPLYILLTKGA